jgi:hypothetical protein
MSNIAKLNPCLQHLQSRSLKLNRYYKRKNKRFYFNEQLIILDRDLKDSKCFYDSSIGYILRNLLDGLNLKVIKKFCIRCRPILMNVTDNLSSPPRIYYCSSLHKSKEINHKLEFNKQNKLINQLNITSSPKIKNKSNTIAHVYDFIFDTDLYTDESEEQEVIQIEKNFGRKKKTKIIITEKRVSSRIKRPIKRLQY